MLFRVVSSSSCPKCTKLRPFLFIPHARPAFSKYALTGVSEAFFGFIWKDTFTNSRINDATEWIRKSICRKFKLN